MLLAAISNHQRVDVAIELAGIRSRATFYNWLRVALRASQHLEAGGRRGDLTVHERRCLDFSRALAHAMAQAEGFAVNDVVNAGRRPQVERRTRTRFVGLGENNQPIMVEEVTTVERPPDWRARAWWLEKRVPAFHPRQEISGPGGRPIPIEVAARVENLADTIRAHQQGVTAG